MGRKEGAEGLGPKLDGPLGLFSVLPGFQWVTGYRSSPPK
jgi:hypothetical protein